jgi:oligopeptidase A
MNPFLCDEEVVSWSKLTPEHVVPGIHIALTEAKEGITQIITAGDASYEGCFVAFEKVTERLGSSWRKVIHLSSVCDAPKLREAINEMLPQVSDFFNGLYINNELWVCVEKAYQSEKLKTGIERRHMEEVRDSFIQNGAQLEEEQKEDLVQINRRLAKITKKYSDHVLDATNDWDLIVKKEEELAGLPDSARKAARVSAKKKGSDGWRFTLQRPSLAPVLQHCQNRTIRESVWRASSQIGRKGTYNNLPIVIEILSLRKRRAQILGYENFPNLILSRRMAKSGDNALRFIEDLHSKVQSAFLQEVETLEGWVAEKNGSAQKIAPWDFSFYAEAMRKEKYAVDDEVYRDYFPIDAVLGGLFSIAKELYGVDIQELPSQFCEANQDCIEGSIEVWHEQVRAYALFDEDGSKIGLFYTDWFPRETKRAGAWMNPLRSGTKKEDGTFSLNVGVIAGNMTAPIGDTPALLKHREVVTVFHEFGHLLHHLFGRVSVPALNGTNVAWDFVELPSQIMENWCWETRALHRFARHYQTNEVLPDALIDKMKKARNYHSAYGTMRQLSFAKLDLELHLRDVKWNEETIDEEILIFLKDYVPSLSEESPSMITRFGHLFSGPVGYAAGYYSYKWAEVLDADAFSRFEKEGIFNREVGKEFRDLVLSKGNSAPPETLFEAFMGREPDADALLRRSGLLT